MHLSSQMLSASSGPVDFRTLESLAAQQASCSVDVAVSILLTSGCLFPHADVDVVVISERLISRLVAQTAYYSISEKRGKVPLLRSEKAARGSPPSRKP